MNFTKMQGLGNDFIFIEDYDEVLLKDEIEIAKKVCDRRFGIGADGLVLVRKSKIADSKMIIINSDGSRANMCGNATRCFAKYLYENKLVLKDSISIETGDGVKVASIILNQENKVQAVRVNMGSPSFLGEDIPLNNKRNLIDESVKIGDREYKLTALLMGVPHAVIVDKDNIYDVSEGRFIEKHNLFLEGINVNFVDIFDLENVTVRTWERGAGATLACGTGCCASIVALEKLGLCKSKVNVKTLGGNLLVEIIEGDVYMTGSAEFICKGIVY